MEGPEEGQNGEVTAFEARRDAAVEVCKAIEASLGANAVHDWLWNCTPYPAGLPSDAQLADGRAIAAGTVTLGEVQARIEKEEREILDRIRKEREQEKGDVDEDP